MDAQEWRPPDLGSLFGKWFELQNRAAPYDSGPVIDLVLSHPVSLRVLQSACTKAMGPWAHDANRRNDVLQEAICSVMQSLQARAFLFDGDDPHAFLKW